MQEIKKVVIWGHKLHSHTHSYVHNGFYRAFKHMGYDAYWFDNSDDISEFDFTGSLFITEGQVDEKIPLRDDCFYVTHNCYSDKYKSFKGGVMPLQVYTDDVLGYGIPKVEEGVYYDGTLYMSWATDLLPNEIILEHPRDTPDTCWFIGSMGEGEFGNINELTPFKQACEDNGIKFCHASNISMEENRDKIRDSYLAPAIVGRWQKEKGYIPCRIFKNISYGQIGLTNSAATKRLLGDHVIYSADEYDLFRLGEERLNSRNYIERLEEDMAFIRDNHTYINRINTILKFL